MQSINRTIVGVLFCYGTTAINKTNVLQLLPLLQSQLKLEQQIYTYIFQKFVLKMMIMKQNVLYPSILVSFIGTPTAHLKNKTPKLQQIAKGDTKKHNLLTCKQGPATQKEMACFRYQAGWQWSLKYLVGLIRVKTTA